MQLAFTSARRCAQDEMGPRVPSASCSLVGKGSEFPPGGSCGQDAPEARRFAGLLARTTQALPDLPGLSPAREVDAAGLDALEPGLGARFPRGLYLPDEGQLDVEKAAGGERLRGEVEVVG